MKKTPKISAILSLVFLLSFSIVYAQSEEITLKFSRDFGYASGTGKIQGLFSMKVASSEQLTKVVFFIDSESIGKDETEPFAIQFNTDNYSPGVHTLYAIGHTNEGKELKTREEITEFLTAKDSKTATLALIIPILGLSLIVVILSSVVPAFLAKKKGSIAPGTERNYGAAGGAICSKCNRTFSRHVFAPNILIGKLERCPHCGKWGIFRAYPIDILRKTEESELTADKFQAESKMPIDEDEKLRIDLDSTKYNDL